MLNRLFAGVTGILAIVGSAMLHASPLTVTNTANHDITITINGECSHEFGVIKSMTNITVDEVSLARLCKTQSGHCLAQIFNSTICRDKYIANFYFNTSKGTTGESAALPQYHLTIQPHAVVLSMN